MRYLAIALSGVKSHHPTNATSLRTYPKKEEYNFSFTMAQFHRLYTNFLDNNLKEGYEVQFILMIYQFPQNILVLISNSLQHGK